MIRIIGPKDKVNDKQLVINTTSRSTVFWSKQLSPFYLGPVELYNNFFSLNMENAWQYSKVYPEYLDNNGDPSSDYFVWAKNGWNRKWGDRYPMGKGKIPVYSFWNGEKLNYIEARKQIYLPLYQKAVIETDSFKKLKDVYKKEECITLFDFDGYDYSKLNMTLDDVLNEPKKKMGHAFVLAMMLEEKI